MITGYNIAGCFNKLSDKDQDYIMNIVASFHYRNGVKHGDGSRGTVMISPGELNDVIAYTMIREGVRNHE